MRKERKGGEERKKGEKEEKVETVIDTIQKK